MNFTPEYPIAEVRSLPGAAPRPSTEPTIVEKATLHASVKTMLDSGAAIEIELSPKRDPKSVDPEQPTTSEETASMKTARRDSPAVSTPAQVLFLPLPIVDPADGIPIHEVPTICSALKHTLEHPDNDGAIVYKTYARIARALASYGESGKCLIEWFDSLPNGEPWKIGKGARLFGSFLDGRENYREIYAVALERGWNPPPGYMSESLSTTFNKPRRSAFGLTPVGQLISTPAATDSLIKDTIARNSLVALYGAPGVGKTHLAMDWAWRIATGTEWLGRRATSGPVVYLLGEGNSGAGRRFAAAEIQHDVCLKDAQLFVSNFAAPLETEIDAVIERIDTVRDVAGTPPIAIFVDTLARHTVADENSAKDMGAFIRCLDTLRERYGSTVIILHHTGHGEETQKRGRGSSALPGAVDTQFVLSRGKDNTLVLLNTKSKDTEELPPVTLRIQSVVLPERFNDEDGKPTTSAVIVPCVGLTSTDQAFTPNQQTAMDVIRELGGPLGRASKRDVSCVLGEKHGIDRRARFNLVGQLAKKGAIRIDGEMLIDLEALAQRFDDTGFASMPISGTAH
jgi:hypothetical protein